MDLEKDIFKKSIIDNNKLVKYGFKKNNNKYIISKNILNNTFRIDIEIENNIVKGSIYDLAFNEEYTNYRVLNQIGEFVNKIREEFINYLEDIKNNCTITNYFVTKQANRITELIIDKYHDIPVFLWDSYPGNGVFKNINTNKWYGIIMPINKNKLTNEDKEIEILNVKLAKEDIKRLLKEKGYYEAYHMNKENWITIILDDSIDDEVIMELIDQSYQFAKPKKTS